MQRPRVAVTDDTLSFCLITTFYPPYSFGGDAIHVYRLANELARRGHRVTVVHSRTAFDLLGDGPAGAHLPSEPGVTVHSVESRLGPIDPLATYLSGRPALSAPALRDVFRERFDVVHFHNVSLIGGPGVLSYGDGVKLYTMNEHWLVCPMHVLWKRNREPCVKRECLRCTLSFRRPPQLWRYTGLLERQLDEVDVFLSPSRFTIEAHRSRGFSRPIVHLPHFLPEDGTIAAGQTVAIPTDRPYFLVVGRLERLKGVHTLLDTFRRYRAADLVVVGDGVLAPELRRLAGDLPHVHFLGRVRPDALAPLYADALALVVPSIGYEVFGLVILEALAQGTPAIVHDLGALPELISDSGGGLAYRTEEELVAALERIRTDPGLREQLGSRGREACRTLWSADRHVERYLGLIAGAKRGSRP
jgi:glycosyltransferase involved in cell wall biosynthesis